MNVLRTHLQKVLVSSALNIFLTIALNAFSANKHVNHSMTSLTQFQRVFFESFMISVMKSNLDLSKTTYIFLLLQINSLAFLESTSLQIKSLL